MNTVLFGVVIVPAIIGIVTVFTNAGLPSHFAPLVDLVLGIGCGFAALATGGIPTAPLSQEIVEAIVAGIGVGLTASGVYQAPSQAVRIWKAIGTNGTGPPAAAQ